MFKFIEFQEYTGQVNLALKQDDLQPLRLFFECIKLAEDSYLGIQDNLLPTLQEELRVATKEENLHGSMASEIKAYRKPLKTSVEFSKNLNKAKEHLWRKDLVNQLLDPARALHQKLQALCSTSLEHKSIQRRLNSLSGHSIYFEIFSTQALLKLSELSQEVEYLLKHLQKLKNRLKQNKSTFFQPAIKYLEALETPIKKFKESLCENLLNRLESAHKSQNLHCSDNLYELVQSMNTLLNSSDKIKFPEKARTDFSENHFYLAQKFIFSNGSLDQKRRLTALSWHSANSHYGKIPGYEHSPVSIAPTEIIPWIPVGFNWFYYLFSPAYHYRRNFMKNYGYLISEQKLLSELKLNHTEINLSPNNQTNLSYLRNLEFKINENIVQLRSELIQESKLFLKSTHKIRLINSYIQNLKSSLCLIYSKKIEILGFHAERLKTYVSFPELNQYGATETLRFYQKNQVKIELFNLHQEVLEAITLLNDTQSRASKARLNFSKFIFDRFYNPKPESEEEPPLSSPYSIAELESFSNTIIENLSKTSLVNLKLKLDCYKEGCKIHSSRSSTTHQNIIEKSLYQFVYNYLQFLNKNSDNLKYLDEKIELIENTLLEINPVVTDFIKELQILRKKPDLRCTSSQIKLQTELLMRAIFPQISKRSLELAKPMTVAETRPTNPLATQTRLSPSTYGAK